MGKKKFHEVLPSPEQLLSEIADLKKRLDILVCHTESVEIWVDADRKVDFISPGIEKMSGYSAIEFLNDSGLFTKIIHPDDVEAYRTYYEKTTKIGPHEGIDRRIVSKDGEIRWIHTRITPLFDEQGRYQGFRSSTTDITRQKLAEQKLEQEKETYRIVSDYTSDMERWVLPDKSLAYISPSCETITGYTREEFMNKQGLFMEIIHPDDKSWFSEQPENSFTEDRFTERNDVRIVRKDGQVRWIDTTAVKVYDRNGGFCGFRTSSRDITHQKELEKDLETKTKLLSSIAEDQPDMIIRTNADGAISFINNPFAEFFGLDRKVVTGKKYFEIIDSSDIEKIREHVLQTTIDHPLVKAVIEYSRSGGKVFYIDWIFRHFYNKDGQLTDRLGIGRNVTETISLNRKLQRSEELYKTVVNKQSELIVRHLPDSTIVFVNDAFTAFTGVKREELLGMKWVDLVPVEVSLGVEKLMESLTPIHPVVTYEMVNKRPDGEERWISWISTGFFDSTGKLSELQVVGRDITDMKETKKKLEKALENVQELKKKLEDENKYLREKVIRMKTDEELVSNSEVMQEVLEMAKSVAGTDSPVLLTGETGTGKEVLGQYIHNLSKRRKKTMITVNCGALPSSLIESELFGREKGAYTGALSRQIGRFELAHQSTLFLDEIGELPIDLQVKLLRVIQSGEFQMLGSPETKKVDVRIIAATNRNLDKEIENGTFRKDLYYRLNVFPIHLPPLRERKEDLPMLAWDFVDKICTKMGKTIEKISNLSMTRMLNYTWPGNIRELRNILEYSIILCKSHILEVRLPDFNTLPEISDNFNITQRMHIEKVLNQTGWRVRGPAGAAEILGMKESTLRAKMKKLGIERK